MNCQEIIRKEPLEHNGYQLSSISRSLYTHVEVEEMFTRLQRIPRKISAYVQKSKIKAVFKSSHARDPRNNYYIVQTTDGTLFHLEY